MKVAAATLALAGLLVAGPQVQVGPIRALFAADSLEPDQGPIAGGTLVTIRGSALSGATVTLDGVPFTPTAQTDTSITLSMPPHDNGYVIVAVRATDGSTAYRRYLYIPPRLDEISAGSITTVAGVGNFKGDFGPALEATVDPNSLAFDRQGNLYVAEPNFMEVTRIRPDGIIERFAGNGVTPRSDRSCCGDGGPAVQAQLQFPTGVAVDNDGNVFITENDNRVRRVDGRTGIISTFAGNGTGGFSGDGGPATSARIGLIPRVVVSGNAVFFVDFTNARIRKVGADGRISTVAGNGVRGFSGDGGPATAAALDFNTDPDSTGLAADPSGNLFWIEQNGERVRRLDVQTGVISTFLTYHSSSPSHALASDRDGNIYVAVPPGILKVSPSGAVVKSWGNVSSGFSPDGTLLENLQLATVMGITFDSAGNLLVGDSAVSRVRRLNLSANRIETIAGQAPTQIGEEGLAVGAALKLLNGDIALTRTGELLIADLRVRRVSALGMITTIAGRAFNTAAVTNKDNVPALDYWNGAQALFVGPNDEIDTASYASAPYHIDSRGIAHRLTSGGRCAELGDGGPQQFASLCQAWDVARDRDGNIFYADTNNNRIRRIDAVRGTMTTVVGTGPSNGFENYYPGKGTFCGDGGPAVEACLASPASIAFDADGTLFVSDTMNRRIRRVDRLSGIITTFVTLKRAPMTIRFDRNGYLYVNLGDRLARFDRNGGMQIVAGSEGSFGFAGDGGPALQAKIDMGYAQSSGIAINDAGDVFFVDAGNRRVRVVKAGAILSSQ